MMPAAGSRQASGLAHAGATAWRLLGIGLLVVATWWLARRLMPVLLPFVVALLLATLLRPVAASLERRRWPPAASALAAMILLVGVVGGAVALILPPFVARLEALGVNVKSGLGEVTYSVAHGVAGISRSQADRVVEQGLQNRGERRSQIIGDVLTGVSTVVQVLGDAILVAFLCFFVVKDGARIRAWLIDLTPRSRRPALEAVAADVWGTLGTYIRGVVLVATVDAVFIGLALILVGVPLALPLIVLTWVGAFFPIIGALVAGLVAVLVALVAKGTASALIVLGVIVLVQQLEGNVLYPVLVGPRLRLHPLVVLLAVTIGGTVGGIAGAFLAVPLATVGAVILDHARAHRPEATDVELPSAAEAAGAAARGTRGGRQPWS